MLVIIGAGICTYTKINQEKNNTRSFTQKRALGLQYLIRMELKQIT